MNFTNSSTPAPCVFPLAYKVTVSSLLAITFLFSPILNLIVCCTILKVKRLHTLDYMLVANLSVTDIIISLSLPSLEIMYVSIYPKWLIGKLGTYALNAVWLFSLVAPFVTVTFIAFERYKTLSSLVRVTSQSIIVSSLAFIWFYISISIFFMALTSFTVPGAAAYEWNILPTFYYTFLALHIVVPLMLVVILNICIFRKARASGRGAVNSNAAAMFQITQRESRMAKTMFIAVGIMFVVWIPALVLEYFYAAATHSCLVQMAGPVSVWLSCSNGIVNPVLYFYRNATLRKETRKMLPKAIRKLLCLKVTQRQYETNAPAAFINKACQTGEEPGQQPAPLLTAISDPRERTRTLSETISDIHL